MAGAGADIELALKTLALKMTCSHCGKEGDALQRCSTCKNASYCGAECQTAGWKQHKKTCQPLNVIFEKVLAACASRDWRGLIKWEGRLGELLAPQSVSYCEYLLRMFASAHRSQFGACETATCTEHAPAIVRLETQRVELLGKMERLRDQGEAMCEVADNLLISSRFMNDVVKRQEAAQWHHRARALGAAHGFFSVECEACQGLGKTAIEEGRMEEGFDLLRNALVYPTPSTLNPQPSTLNPQPSTLNPQPSTLNSQPLTLNPKPYTLYPYPKP